MKVATVIFLSSLFQHSLTILEKVPAAKLQGIIKQNNFNSGYQNPQLDLW
jgi:hypothetical protein